MQYQIVTAKERGLGEFGGWLHSRHTFSFANYYNPNFMGFSDLRVINEDRVKAHNGFGTHPHKNMEILSYVLNGEITHEDSMGNRRKLKRGEIQIMSAGTGVTHSEMNETDDELHFYQIWILPNKKDVTPRYEQKTFPDQEGATLILAPEASGEDSHFKVYQDMRLERHQYKAGAEITLDVDNARRYWFQIVHGDVEVSADGEVIGRLGESDALALVDASKVRLTVKADTEFLLFDLQ